MELTCPKCHGTMRTYERNGVHVDQCTECRGIFLDRGELERLVDAENAWHGGGAPSPAAPSSAAPSSAAPSPGAGPGGPHTAYDAPRPSGQPNPAGQIGAVVSEVLKQARAAQSSSHGHGAPHRKKKQSFLGELFG